jgi:hypothetical protein
MKPKVWFEKSYAGEESPKFYLDWHKHHAKYPWKGFSVYLGLLNRVFVLTGVTDFKKYDERINRRRTAAMEKNP